MIHTIFHKMAVIFSCVVLISGSELLSQEAAIHYQDKKQTAEEEDKADVASIDPKRVIKMAAFANEPTAHHLAKKLIKSKKRATTPADNFLLAIIAENPAEIKRTYKELGSLASYLEGCVPKKIGEDVFVPARSISPFAFIRSDKVAKLVLSLEKNIIPVRVNWLCMNEELLQTYINAKIDLAAESEKIDWLAISSELITTLKKHGITAPTYIDGSAAAQLTAEELESFFKSTGHNPSQLLIHYAVHSEIEPCQKLELLVQKGMNVQDKDYISSVLEKPEIVKTLLRLGAKKEKALKKVTDIISQLENNSANAPSTTTDKAEINAENYRTYCYVRDLLEGKVPLDEPSGDMNKKQGKTTGKISAKLQDKARKKLRALGIEETDYNKELKKVIVCKTEADKKLAKALILAGADVKTNGSIYLKKAAEHPDVVKLLRIAGANEAESPANVK